MLSLRLLTGQTQSIPPFEDLVALIEKSKSVCFVSVIAAKITLTDLTGIPDADARLSILKVILANTPHNISDQDLRDISSRAHGYVGADLSAVAREAGTLAIKHWITASDNRKQAPLPSLTISDLYAGLTLVQPSAMRSVFLETPTVRWADIGGQSYVQQKLRECVEWPLRYPETFTRLGVRAPKGVLLYGPPGCSKTLTARALATESGLNFIAVKGPEVSSMA